MVALRPVSATQSKNLLMFVSYIICLSLKYFIAIITETYFDYSFDKMNVMTMFFHFIMIEQTVGQWFAVSITIGMGMYVQVRNI